MRRPSLVFWAILVSLLYYFEATLFTVFIFFVAAVAAALIRAFVFQKMLQHKVPSDGAIFITGTSSGFGRLMALHFARKGLLVFAGVRKQEHGESLVKEVGNSGALVPVICDVTKQEQIDKAVETVTEECAERKRSLYYLINNAGVNMLDPVECMPDDKLRWGFDVNFFGAIATTRAFLPILRKSGKAIKGGSRVLFVSSIAGYSSLPYMSVYAASKHALEGVVEGMGHELRCTGQPVHATLIQPGCFKTDILKHFDNSLEEWKDNPCDEKVKKLYEKRYVKFLGAKIPLPDASWVVNETDSALFAYFPPARVSVGFDAFILDAAMLLCPDSVIRFVLSFVL